MRGQQVLRAGVSMSNPVLVDVMRGDVVESRHRGAIVVCDGDGRVVLAQGALAEVAALLAQRLDPALPAMRALGVPELAAHLRGELALDEAVARATLATGQYTKRQATWFRHRRMADPARTHTIHARVAGLAQFSEREWADLLAFIQETG